MQRRLNFPELWRRCSSWIVLPGLICLGLQSVVQAQSQYISTKIGGNIWIENRLHQALDPLSGLERTKNDYDADITAVAFSSDTINLSAGGRRGRFNCMPTHRSGY